jgi:hypothetical protein
MQKHRRDRQCPSGLRVRSRMPLRHWAQFYETVATAVSGTTDSVRPPGGTCYGSFRPVAVADVSDTATELELEWDGTAIVEYPGLGGIHFHSRLITRFGSMRLYKLGCCASSLWHRCGTDALTLSGFSGESLGRPNAKNRYETTLCNTYRSLAGSSRSDIQSRWRWSEMPYFRRFFASRLSVGPHSAHNTTASRDGDASK